MSPTRYRVALRVTGAVGLVALELVFARAYVVRGTSWHLLLHTLIGLGLGLAAASWWTAIRNHPTRPLPWAVAGQVVSSFPDLLFVFAREPHQRWMDVFVGHIAVHTAPQPLLIALAVFLLGGWGWERATTGSRAGPLLGAAAALLLGVALIAHTPVPRTLDQYPATPGSAAFWCR